MPLGKHIAAEVWDQILKNDKLIPLFESIHLFFVYLFLVVSAMHRVGSATNAANSVRPRKEKRFTYVLKDADDTKVRLPHSEIGFNVDSFVLNFVATEKG